MSKDIQNLEREIEVDRSLLERTLQQLTEALSPEQISSSVAREISARGGTLGQTVVDAARANPAGAALVGAGLVALMAGPKRPTQEPPYDVRDREVVSGQSGHSSLSGEFDRRVEAASSKGAAPAAPRMRAALNDGLANLPAPARKRVIKARKAAIELQEKVDRKAAIAARKARSFHQRQPISTGAVAVGVGAIVAALLPRTRVEDEVLGARRDALLQQAEFALRDELAAATQTGEAALRDGLEAGYERLRHN